MRRSRGKKEMMKDDERDDLSVLRAHEEEIVDPAFNF